MSTACKGEYEVFKIVRDCIIEGLTQLSISGFDVRRFAQANFNHGDSLVLINYIGNNRVGWQGRTYKTVLGTTLKRKDEWLEEQTYQISTLKKMQQNDTTATVSAEDVATLLITWFNGVGTEYLRSKGVAPLPIDPNSIIVYNDDSDLYQRRPMFTVKIQVPKEFQFGVNHITACDAETYPV